MSIKVLHTEWSDGWGGQEIRIINEMKALRDKGVELFLATRPHAKIKEKALKEGFKVFDVPFRGNLDFNSLFQLIKIIKKNNIDIVNTHSGKDTWVGGFAAKLAGAKFIRTRHLSNPINSSRLNFINEIADFIITTGESVKEDMIKNNRINPEKITSIPTGVDENIFDPQKYNQKESRKQLNLPLDKTIIGFLGILRSVKNPYLFIDIAKEFPDILFVLGGNGPLEEDLKNYAKDIENIKFLGFVQSPIFLSAIDILLLTSKNEGVPQSVIQALLMEKDVIASNVGSVKDLKKENNLLLVNNKEEFIKNLNSLLKKDIILTNKRESMKDFTLERMSEKILDIYKKVLS